jgi:hypothetical protein
MSFTLVKYYPAKSMLAFKLPFPFNGQGDKAKRGKGEKLKREKMFLLFPFTLFPQL